MATVTGRQAMPLRIHQIWDAIGRYGSSQVLDFEKLLEVVTNMHKVPKDELNQELEHAIKDKLIAAEVIETKQQREETEVYSLPSHESFERGDHDWYCFDCHLPGPVVKCEDCPRVFHLDCLPDDRKPDKDLFVCPPCHIMSTKPSAEKLGLKPKQLNQLIEYVCNRFDSWDAKYLQKSDGAIWAEACGRNAKEAWRYDLLVYTKIDLTMMSKKATSGKYQSLEEFQVDCETLVHSIGVYYGRELLKAGQIGASFIKDAMHDIQEIKLCNECFRRSNEKNHDWWFCLPCNPQHDVVWAKQTGYPYWPAKVMKREGNKYDVRYFGGNYERGIIDSKNIQPIETEITKLKVRRTAVWNDAYDELKKFQEIAENPELVSSLPNRGGKGAATTPGKKVGNKRSAANSAAEESPVIKKSRKSEPAPTPAKASPKKSVSSAKSSLKDVSPKANGNSTSQTPQSNKKKPPTSVKSASSSGTPARRDSTTKSASNVRGKRASAAATKESVSDMSDVAADESLDPDLRNILMEMDEESLGGSISFSDDESSELHDKVSEDAVSSSCNESKSTRNAYVQVSRPGTKEFNVEKLSLYISDLKERHKADISLNKRKQWCFNCEREAIYHCCWNTAYCSIECQQQHWTKEHKRLCRRVRRDRGGSSGQNDDY